MAGLNGREDAVVFLRTYGALGAGGTSLVDGGTCWAPGVVERIVLQASAVPFQIALWAAPTRRARGEGVVAFNDLRGDRLLVQDTPSLTALEHAWLELPSTAVLELPGGVVVPWAPWYLVVGIRNDAGAAARYAVGMRVMLLERGMEAGVAGRLVEVPAHLARAAGGRGLRDRVEV